MQLLAVQDDTFINADKINSIKIRKMSTGVSILINLEGQTITLKRPVADFLNDLSNMGIDLVDKIDIASKSQQKMNDQFVSL